MDAALWTVLPVRGIATGKSRLGTALDAAGRAALNRRLLETTLDAVASSAGGLRRCIVVSPCAEARVIAADRGAAVLCEHGGGLNSAVAEAAAVARAAGAAQLLVIPCDLPRLDAGALHVLTDLARPGRHMVIAPDRSGSGTNALLIDARSGYPFRFGEHSFAKHRAWAAAQCWSVSVCRLPALAFDLDTPEDLTEWQAAARHPDVAEG